MEPWQIYRLPWKKVITHHYPIEADWWAGVKVILQISPRGQWLLVTGRKEREGELPHREPRFQTLPTALRGLASVWSYFSWGPCFISCCKACAIEIKLGIQMYPNKEHANGLNKEHGFPCLILRNNTTVRMGKKIVHNQLALPSLILLMELNVKEIHIS